MKTRFLSFCICTTVSLVGLFSPTVAKAAHSGQVTPLLLVRQESLWDRRIEIAIAAAKKTWEMVQKQGKPFAERILRAGPAYYKDLQTHVSGLAKEYGTHVKMDTFQEKQQLLLELWKLRSAINVAVLTDPDLLRELTGIDTRQMAQIQKQFRDTVTRLKKENPSLLGQF